MTDSPLFPGLKDSGSATATESAPIQENTGVPDLFGEVSSSSTTAAGDSKMVNAVVSKNDSDTPILGPKPTTSSGLEVRPHHFSWGGFVFKLSILAALVMYAFFYSQLSLSFPLFGKNPAQTLADLESSVEEEQTSVNFYNFLIAKFAIDDFAISADSYLSKYAEYESIYTSNNTKAELESELALLQDQMKSSLETIQDKLQTTLYPKELAFTADSVTELEVAYETLLKDRIAEERQVLRDATDESAILESNNLDSLLALLNDESFQRELLALDLSSDLSAETIQSLFEASTAISKNEFSTILSIKNTRVDWSSVLKELTSVTRQVDPLYGSGISSNIEYTNLTFNSSDQSILLRGNTRTNDTLNFSLISDLIDELEASALFIEVSNRSFNKSEEDDDYTATFSISLQLQSGEDARDDVASYTTSSSSSISTSSIVEETPEEIEEVIVEEVTESTEEEPSIIEGALDFLDVFGAFFEQVPQEPEEERIPRTF